MNSQNHLTLQLLLLPVHILKPKFVCLPNYIGVYILLVNDGRGFLMNVTSILTFTVTVLFNEIIVDKKSFSEECLPVTT